MPERPEHPADETVFETFMGRERTPVRLSLEDYRRWLDRIREDRDLIRDLIAIRNGTKRMEDLDEGDAGIFAGRAFPQEELARITEKLDHVEPRRRVVIVAFLLPKVLSDLHTEPGRFGPGATC